MSEAGSEAKSGRSERTRAALVTAAGGIFAERRFLDARINDITAAAGVSVGTFYNHFGSKETLFAEVAAAAFAELRAVLEGAAGQGPDHSWERVEALIAAYLEELAGKAALWAAVEEGALAVPELRGLFWEGRRSCVEAIARGLGGGPGKVAPADGIGPEAAAFALAAMAEQCTAQWFLFEPTRSVDEGVDQLTRIWATVLGVARD
jgi:AcrR family transcriptional regulator